MDAEAENDSGLGTLGGRLKADHESDAARQTIVSGNPESASTRQRAAEIRKRLVDGTYDSLEVMDQVARRIIASGDI